jgi:hypothetical protein
MSKILCDSCKHRLVCINRAMYEQFQQAAEELVIDVPHSVRRINIKDVPWLNTTKLDCVNYLY